MKEIREFICLLIAVASIMILIIYAATEYKIHTTAVRTAAAIKDNGCSTHPHKVIEQKQIKDNYVKWGE